MPRPFYGGIRRALGGLMKSYIVKLKARHPFSTLPTANSILGSIAWQNEEQGKSIDSLIHNTGEIIFSDAFIGVEEENKEYYFLPKPFLGYSVDIKELKEDFEEIDIKSIYTIQKRVKSLKWINYSELFQLISDECSESDLIDGALIGLEKSGFKKQFAIGYTGISPLKEVLRQRNRINRITGSSEESGGTFYTTGYQLAHNGFLYFLVQTDKMQEYKTYIQNAFSIGIGKNKSIGFGQFEVEVIEKHPLIEKVTVHTGEKSHFHYILSNAFLPLSKIDLEKSYYSITGKRSRSESRIEGESLLKAKVNLFSSGSVIKSKSLTTSLQGENRVVKQHENGEIYYFGQTLTLSVTEEAVKYE